MSFLGSRTLHRCLLFGQFRAFGLSAWAQTYVFLIQLASISLYLRLLWRNMRCSDCSLTMLTIRSTKCRWAFVGVAGTLVMLVTAVHVFMVPILPSSLDYFGARRTIGRPRNVLPAVGVVDSRLRGQFPSDSYGAVTFRGAPWKAEIGRWLAGCHTGSSTVNVTEVCIYLCH